MGMEIERKFLVEEAFRDGLRDLPGVRMRQGYLSANPDRVARIRVSDGEGAWLTVKGRAKGIARREIETPIDPSAALEMLEMAEGLVIEKIRRRLEVDGKVWEIDEFLGAHKGLWLAEIELSSETEKVSIPLWAGAEVSEDPRFQNANLSRSPWSAESQSNQAPAAAAKSPRA